MKRLRRLILLLVASIIALGAVLASIDRIGLFQVTTIPVELLPAISEHGHERATLGPAELRLKDRIENILKPFAGLPVWKIDLSRIRAAISSDEWVKEILISRSFPNGLGVRIRPKAVALIMVGKQGEFIPVTDDGETLRALSATQLPDVPLLRGEVFAGDRARRDSVVKFALGLGEEGALGRANISEISWSADDGYSLLLIQPKVEVKLGEERVELKAMRVAQVLNYMAANNLKGRVIDASFSKKVLVRVRKGP